MRYCTRCIIPETRPHITFDARGVCNACRGHAHKTSIDWKGREASFLRLVQGAKQRGAAYDCIIPVSGGKDSTWQVVTCLQYGLRPLAVTWKTPGRTPLGERNLRNLVNLGVDHLDFQVNPWVERKFLYEALATRGSSAIPMHMALFSVPLRAAVQFDVPLVIWGENSPMEYGGTEEEQRGFTMDQAWLKKFGVTQGTTAEDWVSDRLTREELTPYVWPTDAELAAGPVRSVFLGAFLPWDPQHTFEVARRHGFEVRADGPLTGYYAYADIDDDFIAVHHYPKWQKFGFTRTFDNLSLEIRNGRMTRQDAIEIIRKRGDETPHESIRRFCQFVGITESHFYDVLEKFRNPAIWTREAGVWTIKDFLIPDWDWSASPHGELVVKNS